MPTRIYIITDKTDGTRLMVEASTASDALRVVAQSLFAVSPASALEAVTLAQAGVQVIKKPAPPEQMELLPEADESEVAA